MNPTTTALPALLLLALATPALADDATRHVAITPFVGYRMGGSIQAEDDQQQDVELDDAGSLGVIINIPAETIGAEAHTQWELYYSRQSAGVDGAPDGLPPGLEVDTSYVLAGGNYIAEGDVVQPFLAAGIGVARLSAEGAGDDSVFAFGIGAGAMLFPESRVGLRLEGRVLGAVLDSDSSLFCASGSAGATCAFRASGDVLWQWEVTAGAVVRF
jgi:opacity protein-like surface antigen